MSRVQACIITLLACCGFMGGCASGPKYSEMTLPPIPPGQGRIIFYRDASPFGSGVQPEIKVNQVPVGTSQPNGFSFVDRAPGDYDVTCMTEWEHKTTLKLQPSETHYVHMWVMMGVLIGHVCPEEVDAARAMRELKNLSYNGPPLAAVTTQPQK